MAFWYFDRELAEAVRKHSASEVVRFEGNRVLLHSTGDCMDMLCVLSAERSDEHGYWWTDISRLRELLAEVMRYQQAA